MDDRFREQWEANAEAFTSLIGGCSTPHHKHILNPCIERLLGDARGKRLLDAFFDREHRIPFFGVFNGEKE